MRLLYWFLLFCLILIFTSPLYAQSVSGRVLSKNSEPIARAIVTVPNTDQAAITDDEGNFSLFLPDGEWKIAVSCISYEGIETKLLVRKNKTTFINIVLPSLYKQLPEVAVATKKAGIVYTTETATRSLNRIAGGTSIAILRPQAQRLETIKEALMLEPGVMIQEFFGANDQPRLNIRGSGIQSNPQRRGIYLLQDGIPVNFSDGSYVIGVMDPMVAQFVEVTKGANALQYGAATLGGALNFVSRNGIHNSGLIAKVDAGSFGFTSVSVMGGSKNNNYDVYSGISASRQDGARLHNQNRKLNFTSNLGYSFSKKIQNRLYLNFSYINFDIPGPLTLQMIADDPKQISKGVKLPFYMGSNIARDKPSREVSMLRIAHKTSLQINNRTDLSASIYGQYANDRFVFPIVLSTQHSYYYDAGITAQIEYKKNKHRLKGGVIASTGTIYRNGLINKDGLDSYPFSKDKLIAINTTLFAEEDFMVNDKLHLIANLQAVYNERNSKDVFANPELRPWYSHSSHKYRYFHSENISLRQYWSAFNPRLGVLYNAGEKKDIQFYANISHSYEPPTFDELVGTEVTNNINTSPKKLFAVKLNRQTALTTEAGTRFSGIRYGWNISIYKSWLRNEMLEVKDFVLGIKTTKNYPHTLHSGVELGFMAVPLQHIFSQKNKDAFIIRGVYNYSNFRFSTGHYKGKYIAGVPKHYMAGSIGYTYPEKFSLEFNTEYQPTPTPIDHENTLMQPAFQIFGFKAVYEAHHFSFYLEGKNIFDKRYASSYIINDQIHNPPVPFPNFTAKNLTFFIPGPLGAYYLGITYKL